MASSVSIKVPSNGSTYTFSGILSVTHELSLKILTDGESATGTDYINGARNQPNKVILSVIESDVGHPAGWANRMMQVMESIKRNRTLCDVYTPAFVYAGMLLSEFTATVDETSQSGWTGALTFVQYLKPTGVTLNVYDNSSVAVHTDRQHRRSRKDLRPAADRSAGPGGGEVMYYILPLTEDPRQVFTLDLTIDGNAFHARVEIRYLYAPECWVISIWDNSSGELMINQIPLICSYGQVNDLLLPFRHLRNGLGLGSLFVIRNTDEPKTPDPSSGNLTEFRVLFGDTYAAN